LLTFPTRTIFTAALAYARGLLPDKLVLAGSGFVALAENFFRHRFSSLQITGKRRPVDNKAA
jgi:hypothetical protein